MARVTNPLHSFTATGSIGKMLNFEHTKNGAIVRKHLKKSPNASALSLARREIYKTAVEQWNLLTAPAKKEYNAEAVPVRITGYNLFLKKNITPPPLPQGAQWDNGSALWDNGSALWDLA